MLTGPLVILALKIAVGAVTVLLVASLVALLLNRPQPHGRINIVFFVLTITALLGLEGVMRLVDPAIFNYYDEPGHEGMRHTFRGGGLTRRQLRQERVHWRAALHDPWREGCACTDTKAAAFCDNLLAVEPALWTFVDRVGVAPTNNHVARVLRSGVLGRQNAFGCPSVAGCRFVERLLTVLQPLRWQQRPVLEFLHQAVSAHRQGEAAPDLLGCG